MSRAVKPALAWRSKLTPILAALLRQQIDARKKVLSWTEIAKRHKITRRNLMKHVAALRG